MLGCVFSGYAGLWHEDSPPSTSCGVRQPKTKKKNFRVIICFCTIYIFAKSSPFSSYIVKCERDREMLPFFFVLSKTIALRMRLLSVTCMNFMHALCFLLLFMSWRLMITKKKNKKFKAEHAKVIFFYRFKSFAKISSSNCCRPFFPEHRDARRTVKRLHKGNELGFPHNSILFSKQLKKCINGL